jgi:hypothetical protein
LVGRSIIEWFDRVATRRNDDGGSSAVVDDGVVGWPSVIGAVGRELTDRTVDMAKQRIHLRGITNFLAGQRSGDDLAATGIQRQMQLSPTTAGSGTMLLLQPLARARRPAGRCCRQEHDRSVRSPLVIMPFVRRLPCPRPTAQGGMIGDGKRQAHQWQHRFQQAFGLAQPQADTRPSAKAVSIARSE